MLQNVYPEPSHARDTPGAVVVVEPVELVTIVLVRDQLHSDPLYLVDSELLLRQRLKFSMNSGTHEVAGLDVDITCTTFDGGLEQFLHELLSSPGQSHAKIGTGAHERDSRESVRPQQIRVSKARLS